MSDLISRADAIEALYKSGLCYNNWLEVRNEIDALPSAEIVHNPDYSYEADMVRRLKEALSAEANRPTGEWVLKEHLWECDQCGCRINRAKPLKGNIWNYNFCPNCGAKMLGEDGEE